MDIYNLIFGVKNVELRAAWSFMNHDEEQKNIFFSCFKSWKLQDAALGKISYFPQNMISKLP